MALSEFYDSVSPPYWDEVWIVGGGPSRQNFDLSTLTGKTVLAVNDSAILLCDLVPTLFSLDNNWVRRHRSFLTDFPGEKYLALPLDTWPDCGGIPGVKYLQWGFADGLSEDPTVICTGCHSGYGALNLAYLKRAQKIHLIGYDLNLDSRNDQYPGWARAYNDTLPQLRGVQVLNHNWNSNITAFPKVTGVGAPA